MCDLTNYKENATEHKKSISPEKCQVGLEDSVPPVTKNKKAISPLFWKEASLIILNIASIS